MLHASYIMSNFDLTTPSASAMAGLRILERSHVCSHPPSAPGGPTRLPLTYLDLPWLFFRPSNRLFFYDFPHLAARFTSSVLPLLKSSLAVALGLFFPLAGHLNEAPGCRPAIACSPHSAGVSLTVAESDDDFHDLLNNDDYGANRRCPRQKAADRFHPLVPALAAEEGRCPPIMAVQVTVFPGSGFCVAIAYQHVAADERTFNNFIKAWSSICGRALKGKDEYANQTPLVSPPQFDRATIIKDMPTLDHRFLDLWWKHQLVGTAVHRAAPDGSAVRSTFVVTPAQMDLVKSWIAGHCEANGGLPLPVHLSPYVLACALIWVAWVRTHVRLSGIGKNGTRRSLGERPGYFGFVAGGVSRIGYDVPTSYFGNCVGFGRAEAACRDLVGQGGIFHAASAIGSTIKRLDQSMLDGAEGWISEWQAMLESNLHVMVVGSPKVDFYGTDFGWGRPRKIDEVSIDWSGAVSLHESRDIEGGIEVGLSLPKAKMDVYNFFFNEGLRTMKLNLHVNSGP